MRSVFLDRDGVINENRKDHVKSWEEFRFLPGVRESIARLSRAGASILVVSNQAIVNRGIVSPQVVDDIHRRMVEELRRSGGRIQGVAYCPHRPEEGCRCRKPHPGLLFDLAREHGLELRRSILVGDALSDMDAAQAAGCEAVLVLTGRGEEQMALAEATGKNGFAVVPDLQAAVDLILASLGPVASSYQKAIA